jgi:hypothetical protein
VSIKTTAVADAILAQVKIDEYVNSFNDLWGTHMKNGGRTESTMQKRSERKRIYALLAEKYPLDGECIDAYCSFVSQLRQKHMTSEQIPADAIVGKVIVHQLSGTAISETKQKRKAAKQRQLAKQKAAIPNLVERIKVKLASLKQEELQAIHDLLDE